MTTAAPAYTPHTDEPDIHDATHDVDAGTSTDEQPFDDSNDEEEQAAAPSKPWITATIILAVAILCIVVILILLYIGHLRPLTTKNPNGDNTLKPTNPLSSGLSHSKISGSVAKSVATLLSPAASGELGTAAEGASRSTEHASSTTTTTTTTPSAAIGSLRASVKKIYTADDAMSLSAEDDKYDDAPGLAAFMGLRYKHHTPPAA